MGWRSSEKGGRRESGGKWHILKSLGLGQKYLPDKMQTCGLPPSLNLSCGEKKRGRQADR